MLSSKLLFIFFVSTFSYINAATVNNPKIIKSHRDLIPTGYVYLSIGITLLSVLGFFSFVFFYTINNGCPSRAQQYTEVWQVDRSEQLNRFKIQKRAEELLQERERRKVRESTREEQF